MTRQHVFQWWQYCFLLLLLMMAGAGPAAAESITSLVSDATLFENGRLVVHETIDIDLSGASRHGLFRVLPTTINERGVHLNFATKVHNVQDGRGHKVPYTAKQHGGAVTVHIDTAHSGNTKAVYKIEYESRGVCNFNKKYPELYFPFGGHEWPFPVDKTEVVLHVPKGVRVTDAHLKAWQGPPGGQTAASVRLVDDHILATASQLAPGSGLTLEVDFPGGTISPTGFFDHAEWWMDDWYLLLVLPLVAVAGLAGYRLIRARRAVKHGELESNWNPPYKLTPVELGTLIDGNCDVQDLTGILLDLSIRGYYTIREIPATGFFNLSDRDYEFKKQAYPTQDKLRGYEVLFLEALFGNAGTSYLSNVQGVFRQFVPQLKDGIYEQLVSDGFLMKNPQKDKKRFYCLGFSLCCVGIALLFLYGEEVHAKAAGLGCVVGGALIAVAVQFIPLLTDKGKEAIDRVHDFAELLRTAELHELSERLGSDKFLFDRLLPYAMVLGVSEKWASGCEKHLDQWPDWFQFHRGSQDAGAFIAREFARDVWIATKVAGLTFFAAPPVQYSSFAVGKMGTRKEQEHDH